MLLLIEVKKPQWNMVAARPFKHVCIFFHLGPMQIYAVDLHVHFFHAKYHTISHHNWAQHVHFSAHFFAFSRRFTQLQPFSPSAPGLKAHFPPVTFEAASKVGVFCSRCMAWSRQAAFSKRRCWSLSSLRTVKTWRSDPGSFSHAVPRRSPPRIREGTGIRKEFTDSPNVRELTKSPDVNVSHYFSHTLLEGLVPVEHAANQPQNSTNILIFSAHGQPSMLFFGCLATSLGLHCSNTETSPPSALGPPKAAILQFSTETL